MARLHLVPAAAEVAAGETDPPFIAAADAQALRVHDNYEDALSVAARENARIQIFDHAGKLAESRISPAGNHTYSLKPLGGGRLLAIEGRDSADRKGAVIRLYGADGSTEASYNIGLPGKDASLGHDLAIGPDGHIYAADVPGGRLVRFSLPDQANRTNANQSR
jgi:hypothetical protein